MTFTYLQSTVQESEEGEEEEGRSFAEELIGDASERRAQQHAERQAAQRDPHRISTLFVVGISVSQHAHAWDDRGGGESC